MDPKTVKSNIDDLLILANEILIDLNRKSSMIHGLITKTKAIEAELDSRPEINNIESLKEIFNQIDKYLAILDIVPDINDVV